MNKSLVSKEARLPLETVLLLVAGMALLITGALLFPIAAGSLSYYENGLYGLILVIFALQIALGELLRHHGREVAARAVAGHGDGGVAAQLAGVGDHPLGGGHGVVDAGGEGVLRRQPVVHRHHHRLGDVVLWVERDGRKRQQSWRTCWPGRR